ncbi:TPA: fimbrial protein [Citrobacter amalonaticus]|uniref:fimbrial protein n=1 Tax=Citrobacter TaxID=544 RepID=UPI00292A8CBC|nr:fimbrial protein [Citrobacter amalonaticus]EKW3842929.1 type 1 fimbrial protein [Citrobacter amalonaticus]MDV0786059.1 fimbrial protein [Citrobacter amalonaticus]MEB0642122.1 fimbrial protein [Citrobacter amalonaticus]
MKIINKTAIASLLTFAACHAWATDGTIEFTGQILTSTCEFAGGEVVEIELGHYAAGQFKSIGDKTPSIPVAIPLKNCPIAPWKHVDGTTDASFQIWLETLNGGTVGTDNNLVAVTGMDTAATGVGIRIDTNDGTQMFLNKLNDPKVSFPITGATMNLNLVAYYVSTVDAQDITAGEANASVDVTLDYR